MLWYKQFKKWYRTRFNKDIRDIFKGSFTALVFKVLGMLVGYVFTFIVVRYYGTGALGAFSLSLALLNILNALGKLGMTTVLLKLVSSYRAEKDYSKVKEAYAKVYKVVLPWLLLIVAFVLIFAPQLSTILLKKDPTVDRDALINGIRLVALGVIPLALTHINSEGIRAFKKSGLYSMLQNFINYFLSSIIIGVLIVLGYTSDHIPTISFIVALVIAFGVGSYLLYKYVWRLDTKKSDPKLKYGEIFKLALPMFLAALLGILMQFVDILSIGVLLDKESLGVYTVALKVAQLTSIPLYGINIVTAPKFAEAFEKKDMKRLRGLMRWTIKLSALASVPLCIFFLIFPEFALSVFGSSVAGGANVLRVLSVGFALAALLGPVQVILQMTNKQTKYSSLILVSLVVNIILNIILIPKFGILGAAIGKVGGMMMWKVSGRINILDFTKKK